MDTFDTLQHRADQLNAQGAAEDRAYDAAIKYAADLGAEHGRNAAGWYVQDALSPAIRPISRPVGRAERILRGIADGDPAVLDTFPYPDLSGEWADSLTGPQLVRDACDAALTGRTVLSGDPFGDWSDDICDAYETAFSDAVSAEIERAARAVLG